MMIKELWRDYHDGEGEIKAVATIETCDKASHDDELIAIEWALWRGACRNQGKLWQSLSQPKEVMARFIMTKRSHNKVHRNKERLQWSLSWRKELRWRLVLIKGMPWWQLVATRRELQWYAHCNRIKIATGEGISKERRSIVTIEESYNCRLVAMEEDGDRRSCNGKSRDAGWLRWKVATIGRDTKRW